MIRKDLTIRYACGSYWIISTDVHLCTDASYHAPVMTNEAGYHIWNCLKKHFSIQFPDCIIFHMKMPYRIQKNLFYC